jgi:hypothetical protein
MTLRCQCCRRPVVVRRALDPDDDVLCGRCEDISEDARREVRAEARAAEVDDRELPATARKMWS